MNKKIIGVFVVFAFFVGCGEQNSQDKQDEMQSNKDTMIYNCEGEMIKVTFNNDVEPATAQIYMINKNVDITLDNVESGSGAKYSDGDITFWTHQGEATLATEKTKKSIKCVEDNSAVVENPEEK